jgi:hypothetical protein
LKIDNARNLIFKPGCDRPIVATGPKLIVDIPSGPMYQNKKKNFEKIIIHGFLANVFFSMGNPSNKKKSTVNFFFFPNSMKFCGNTSYGSRMIL